MAKKGKNDEKVKIHELYMYEGEKHSFFNQNPKMHLETLAEMDRFITSLGYLTPMNP